MLKPFHVLVVADGTDSIETIANSVEHERRGLTVETATTAREGFEQLHSGTFDCVVSEYHLPEENGIEFLETVREEYRDLPFVLYPSDGSEALASEAIAAGVTDYVTRDLDTDSRQALVDSIVNAVEESARPVGTDGSQEGLEQILNTVPGCIVQLDLEGRFIYVNDHAKDVLGLERSEVTGRAYNDPEWHITDLSGDPIPDAELPFRQVRDKGEPIYDYHHAIEWPDGSRTELSVNGVPVFDTEGEVERVVFSLTDITERKRRERELKRFQQVVEHLDDIATIIGPDGTIKYVSPAVSRVLGYEPQELEGENGFGYQPPETSKSVAEAIERVLDKPGEPHTVQTKFRRADGSWTWIESTLRNRIDDEAIDGILVSSREISERRNRKEKLEARRQQLNQLHEATRKLLGAQTPEEITTLASDAAVEILELELNGIHLYDAAVDGLTPTAVSESSRELFDEVPVIDEGLAWEAFQQNEVRIYDDLRRTDETYNSDTPARSEMMLPMADHGVFLISSAETDAFEATDIEFARILAANTEAALERITTEQRLRLRESELEQQNDRLEEFTSVVSHDLRNPLNVAQGHLELLRETGDDDHFDTVAQAHDRMESLITDLLTLAREGETADEMESLDLANLVERSWENVSHAEATHSIETEQTIRGDSGRLQQLLENLMRNAIEHGRPNVTVTIGELSDRSGFYVADDGPGIPENERGQVFQAGYSTRDNGTGFGLSIVKQIVEAHDWNIQVTESKAGGARFEITGVVE